MRFSDRTAWQLDEYPFAAQVWRARECGADLIDLTVANPTACGFAFDTAALLAPLSQPAAAGYHPDALGMLSARQAVSAYYSDAGAHIPPENLCLTTSTSEAYSFLFRLLCDPGGEVLVASPSYPLFYYIARLDSVRLVEYPLLYDPHHGWLTDLAALEASITPRTRAILVVHPNNPTGHLCSAVERAALDLCAQHELALIVDEVFLDFPLPGTRAETFARGETVTRSAGRALTFVLSGISKVCGLPQMKCSWIATTGPAAEAAQAIARLEVIADTFLSMNAPVQHALPAWLSARRGFQQQVFTRMTANLSALDAALRGTSCERLAMDAGWSVILRVPRFIDGLVFHESALASGVVVQPGEFYGMPQGRVVLSLLTPEDVWSEGLSRLPKG